MRLIPAAIASAALTLTGGALPHIAPASWAGLALCLLAVGVVGLALCILVALEGP